MSWSGGTRGVDFAMVLFTGRSFFAPTAKHLEVLQPARPELNLSSPPIPHRHCTPSHCPSITIENASPRKKVPGHGRYVESLRAAEQLQVGNVLTKLPVQPAQCGLSTSPVCRKSNEKHRRNVEKLGGRNCGNWRSRGWNSKDGG